MGDISFGKRLIERLKTIENMANQDECFCGEDGWDKCYTTCNNCKARKFLNEVSSDLRYLEDDLGIK